MKLPERTISHFPSWTKCSKDSNRGKPILLFPRWLLSGYSRFHRPEGTRKETTFTYPILKLLPIVACLWAMATAPATFQTMYDAIFHDMIEKTMEVFMDDFSVFENSFSTCLSHLDKMLKRCEDTNLVLNWEKSHFMVKEGLFPYTKSPKSEIEVDRAKVETISPSSLQLTRQL
ncbi:reverse transcriptase domain-containing protein [Tanacetum coccineum]